MNCDLAARKEVSTCVSCFDICGYLVLINSNCCKVSSNSKYLNDFLFVNCTFKFFNKFLVLYNSLVSISDNTFLFLFIKLLKSLF